jgi:uncharacterized protein YcbX
MRVGTISGLWRYPIKSVGGEALDAGTLTTRGLQGDRVYALMDRATDKIASAKLPRLWGQLLECRAALMHSPDEHPAASDAPLQITLPDGSSAVVPSQGADEALSALCGRDARLVATPPEQPEIERYWPDIAGLALRDTISSGPIATGAPPGTFFDYAPLHLLTTASLARLRMVYPAGSVVVRRFRPNLLIAPSDETPAFAENAWVGRTLVIGERVRLRIISPTPRCVVPTLPQPDLPQDLGILRTIVAHNKVPIPPLGGAIQASLGVYAVVEQTGPIRVGDPVVIAVGMH